MLIGCCNLKSSLKINTSSFVDAVTMFVKLVLPLPQYASNMLHVLSYQAIVEMSEKSGVNAALVGSSSNCPVLTTPPLSRIHTCTFLVQVCICVLSGPTRRSSTSWRLPLAVEQLSDCPLLDETPGSCSPIPVNLLLAAAHHQAADTSLRQLSQHSPGAQRQVSSRPPPLPR